MAVCQCVHMGWHRSGKACTVRTYVCVCVCSPQQRGSCVCAAACTRRSPHNMTLSTLSPHQASLGANTSGQQDGCTSLLSSQSLSISSKYQHCFPILSSLCLTSGSPLITALKFVMENQSQVTEGGEFHSPQVVGFAHLSSRCSCQC